MLKVRRRKCGTQSPMCRNTNFNIRYSLLVIRHSLFSTGHLAVDIRYSPRGHSCTRLPSTKPVLSVIRLQPVPAVRSLCPRRRVAGVISCGVITSAKTYPNILHYPANIGIIIVNKLNGLIEPGVNGKHRLDKLREFTSSNPFAK